MHFKIYENNKNWWKIWGKTTCNSASLILRYPQSAGRDEVQALRQGYLSHRAVCWGKGMRDPWSLAEEKSSKKQRKTFSLTHKDYKCSFLYPVSDLPIRIRISDKLSEWWVTHSKGFELPNLRVPTNFLTRRRH